MPPLELLAMEFKRYPMALSKFSPPSRLRDVLRETETSSCWHMPGVHVKREGGGVSQHLFYNAEYLILAKGLFCYCC